jgi:Protein of unknown function (DUF3540)
MAKTSLAEKEQSTSVGELGLDIGPAEIVAVRGSDVDVQLAHGVVPARVALAFLYQPNVGDTALIVGDARGHYVIGILHGTGRTTLDLPGDVDLRAGGTLRLSAADAVEICAPRVHVETGSMRTLAGAVVERFQSLRQRVVELVSLHAGETHTVVEGAANAQSKSATILTEENVMINGREVHLG